jgi:hypothetical protein
MKTAVFPALAAALTLSASSLAIADAAAPAQPASPPPPGAANQSAYIRDMRCMVILSQMKVAPEQQASLQITMNYLMGRMDAEFGDVDWTDRVMQEIRSMEGKDLTAETRACGAYVSAKGKSLLDRGRRLQDMGKAETP